ncbi:MAG TPA: hypothetical protein VEQ63_14425, partial [Bryobacteraceae bacterium]|nr:hypothetical protein [Bryobacteraceae bacterium]
QALEPGASQNQSRVVDATVEAIGRLRSTRDNRGVLLLISGTKDRGSETSLDRALQLLRQSGATIHAFTYSAYLTPFLSKPEDLPPSSGMDPITGIRDLIKLGRGNVVRPLTEESGGTIRSFAKQRGLEEAVEELSAELHSQYM